MEFDDAEYGYMRYLREVGIVIYTPLVILALVNKRLINHMDPLFRQMLFLEYGFTLIYQQSFDICSSNHLADLLRRTAFLHSNDEAKGLMWFGAAFFIQLSFYTLTANSLILSQELIEIVKKPFTVKKDKRAIYF